MVNRFNVFFIFFFSLLLSSQVFAADFSAHVDRTEVNEGDVFTLVLRYEAQAVFKEPDLKPLQQDFRIHNQQRSQQMSTVNGVTESFTSWIINLSPLKTGKLTIPAIKYDKKSSQPIEINVIPLSEEAKKQAEENLFFETKVEPQEGLVVQGQLLYTEKLYFRYQHENASLSEFKVTDAQVQQLGDVRRYTTNINGVQFGVYERQFAIFPEISGELVIPGTRFNANEVDRYSWGRGKPVRAISQPIRLNVAPIPSNYPSNASWLPSRKLVIEEQFSLPPSQWQEGEAVTRTFTIRAQGIQGSQLPEIQLPIVDGVRYYPDQPKTNDAINNFGLVGSSEQAVAMVVTKAGELVLPEVRIPWWNMDTNKLEYATLPARKISVKASKKSASTTSPSVQSESTQVVATETAEPAQVIINKSFSQYFYILAGLLIISIGLNIWLLVRKQSVAKTTAKQKPTQQSSTKQWQALRAAAKHKDLAAVRQQLLIWVNQGGLEHIETPVTSLHSLALMVANPELAERLKELDAALFAKNDTLQVNSEQLLKLLELEKKAKANHQHKINSLYPN